MRGLSIFDSLSHPTINGKWTNERAGLSFSEHKKKLSENSEILGSIICGLPNVGDYEHEEFFRATKIYTDKPVYPVAALTNAGDPESEIYKISDIGYKAVKIHNRLLKTEYSYEFLEPIFRAATLSKITVFLCSFCYCRDSVGRPIDLYPILVKLLKNFPAVKVVLVHGGVHNLLDYYELVRQNEMILLDLSYTLIKYHDVHKESIRYIFKNLDRRLAIGTDGPEYEYQDLISAFSSNIMNLSQEKISNIANISIMKFLNIN